MLADSFPFTERALLVAIGEMRKRLPDGVNAHQRVPRLDKAKRDGSWDSIPDGGAVETLDRHDGGTCARREGLLAGENVVWRKIAFEDRN